MAFSNVVIWQPGETIEQLEERVIGTAVELAGGNKEKAAKALGISTQTIYNHLERYCKQDKERAINKRAQEIVMAEHTQVPDGNFHGENGSFDGTGKFSKAKNG